MLPKLTAQEKEALEAPISPTEFLAALQATKPGKAPGPDGFTSLFYKNFAPELTHPFVSAFNSVSQGNPFPPGLAQSNNNGNSQNG